MRHVPSPTSPWAIVCLALACGTPAREGAGDALRGRDGSADLFAPASLGSIDAPVRADGPGAAWRSRRAYRLGLPCGCGQECDSGFCADGVCCNLACQGACYSCKLPGRMGSCAPVAIGSPDPHGLCTREALES